MAGLNQVKIEPSIARSERGIIVTRKPARPGIGLTNQRIAKSLIEYERQYTTHSVLPDYLTKKYISSAQK